MDVEQLLRFLDEAYAIEWLASAAEAVVTDRDKHTVTKL